MTKPKNIVWIAIGLLIIGGTVLTLKDYRTWQHEERDNYGHSGPSETGLSPAMELALPYVSEVGEFRIKPPVDWTVIVNQDYVPKAQKIVTLPSQKLGELVRFKDPNGKATIVVSAQKTDQDLTTWADKLADEVTRDREYFTVGSTPFTLLTWDGQSHFIQKAIAVSGGKLIVIEATSETNAWKTWTKTFLAVFQSWTRI